MSKKMITLNYIAILLLFSTMGAGTFENPALQTIMNAFPDISESSIRMMITLPCLSSMITMLCIGPFAGTLLSYKNMILIGLITIFVCGILPFLIHLPWIMILVSRMTLGIGVGFCSIRNALLIKSVPQNKISQFIGYGNVIASFTVVLLSPIVGSLSHYGWQYAFLCNSFAFICFILAFFFIKEPDNIEKSKTDKQQVMSKDKIPYIVYGYMIIQLIATCILYPLLSGISSLLSEININDATIAGYMISLYTCGGVLSNFLLPRTEKILQKNAISYSCLMTALGNSLIIFSHHLLLVGLGIFLSGFHFSIISSLLQVYNGKMSQSYLVARTSTLILATNQLGIFLSSYFIDLTSHLNLLTIPIKNVYFSTMIIFICLGIVCFIKRNSIYK